MMDAETVRWGLTGLAGLIMFLWQRTIKSNESEIGSLKIEVQNLKDTRLHKDDFKDFKLELRVQFQDLKDAIKAITPHGNQ